jgi:hypothetical protein
MNTALEDILARHRLLARLLHARTCPGQREKLWAGLGLDPAGHGLAVVFREEVPAGNLARRIEDADRDAVALAAGTRTFAATPCGARLRRLAEKTPGLRAGIGNTVAVAEIHRSRNQALHALAFTGYGGPVARVISYEELGNLGALARLPRQELQGMADLAAITEMDADGNGRAALEALEALCRTGTLRRAAKLLHLHHSSVAKRIGQVEERLGRRLTEPIPLASAYASILALRLLTSADRDELPAPTAVLRPSLDKC